MKRNTILLLSLFMILAFTACDAPVPEEGGSRVSQTAQLNNYSNGRVSIASAYRTQGAVLQTPDVLTHDFELSVSLYKPASEELSAKVGVSREAAEKFQKKSGTSYPILPTEMIILPEEVKIQKGSTSSDVFTASVVLTENIPMNTPHLFAIELLSASGSNVAHHGNIAYFTIERYEETPSVNKVIRLTRDDYLTLDKQFPSGVQALTMEALIYVEKFRSPADEGEAQISTLMGVEGATLLRFGDAGIPGNQLQAAGTRVNYTFQENKWYHIAFTYENGRASVYINGEEQISFFANCGLTGGNRWYIGRSWSDGRGLQGRLAEVRVWNVARSKAQINDSMYLVKSDSDGLLAYWKMNEVKDGGIPDITGNGYNLKQEGQAGKVGQQEPVILTLDEPVDISL